MASKVMFLAISLMCLTFLGETRPLHEKSDVSSGESAKMMNAKGETGNINNPDWSWSFPGAPPFALPIPLPPLPQIPFFPLPPIFPFPLPPLPSFPFPPVLPAFPPPAPEVNPVSPPPVPTV
ncbi:hypothetical protein POM88_022540 [Heracleum sosnowskyi]|uniref:Uncharacterized protein n=1 Tax=Heracleum sosnowskyi TaxID=360622 RepID=A0AAD8IJ12_9APIA|nr:hypothetical protein POM88_022540 [Heracleum sosnowskyi]